MISIEDILNLHGLSIQQYGGQEGIIDRGLLELSNGWCQILLNAEPAIQTALHGAVHAYNAIRSTPQI